MSNIRDLLNKKPPEKTIALLGRNFTVGAMPVYQMQEILTGLRNGAEKMAIESLEEEKAELEKLPIDSETWETSKELTQSQEEEPGNLYEQRLRSRRDSFMLAELAVKRLKTEGGHPIISLFSNNEKERDQELSDLKNAILEDPVFIREFAEIIGGQKVKSEKN